MKKMIKYSTMLIAAVVLTAVVSSFGKSGENDSNTPKNCIVLDGKVYPIQKVDLSDDEPQKEVGFSNETNDIEVDIECKRGKSFPTTLKVQKLKVDLDDGTERDYREVTVPVKVCYDGTTKYQILFSNVKIGNHTLSVSFNGDARDFRIDD